MEDLNTDKNVDNKDSLGFDYQPECWVIIKFVSEQHGTYYKVLGGWSGGYTTGDAWQMNSGIAEVKQDDNYYYFIGFSGSVYKCNKNSQHINGIMSFVLGGILESDKYDAEVIDVEDIKL